MPTYKYNAVSKQGEYLSGEETAKDTRELARALRAKSTVLIDATSEEEVKERRNIRIPNPIAGFFGVSLTDKLMFMRSLKVMVEAGIPLPKTLDVLSLQTQSKKLKNALHEMRERVLQGHQLSDTMESYPAIFPELFYNMIRTGEESGTLETVLTQLTLQVEREHDLKSKIQGALLYPAVILVAMVGIGILMLVLVVPNLADTFEELKVPLPISTQLVIAFAEFLTERWYVALALFAGVFLASLQFLRTRVGKRFMGTVFLKTPIMGPIVKKINTAFFARTMSSLIGAGIPMVRSLEVTSTVLPNWHFKDVLKEGAVQMRKGVKLSAVLSKHTNLYPLVVVQMLEVGEETGQTSDLLGKLAEFFEEEVSNTTKNLASIIEPVLMVIIGAVVGFFAVSMIQPMYAMLGAV